MKKTKTKHLSEITLDAEPNKSETKLNRPQPVSTNTVSTSTTTTITTGYLVSTTIIDKPQKPQIRFLYE
jgi:hypothetical protein